MERLDILFVGIALFLVALMFIYWIVGFIQKCFRALRHRLLNSVAGARDTSVPQPTDPPLRIRIVRQLPLGVFSVLQGSAIFSGFRPDLHGAVESPTAYQSAMLCKLYVEALLVNPDGADGVWRAWNIGLISQREAARAWERIADETAAQQRPCGSASALVLPQPRTVQQATASPFPRRSFPPAGSTRLFPTPNRAWNKFRTKPDGPKSERSKPKKLLRLRRQCHRHPAIAIPDPWDGMPVRSQLTALVFLVAVYDVAASDGTWIVFLALQVAVDDVPAEHDATDVLEGLHVAAYLVP